MPTQGVQSQGCVWRDDTSVAENVCFRLRCNGSHSDVSLVEVLIYLCKSPNFISVQVQVLGSFWKPPEHQQFYFKLPIMYSAIFLSILNPLWRKPHNGTQHHLDLLGVKCLLVSDSWLRKSGVP